MIGWWLVCNMYGSNGWVPGTYLEKADGEREDLTTEKAEPGKGFMANSLIFFNCNIDSHTFETVV